MSEKRTDKQLGKESWSLRQRESSASDEKPWKDDALNRQRVAQMLTKLVGNETGSLVISVSGDWGSGKTFFLSRWQKELQGAGFKAIYFNAWEDDFYNEPLVSIVGKISNELINNVDEENCYDKFLKKVKALVMSLSKPATSVAIHQATGIPVDVGKVIESMEKVTESMKDKTIEGYIEKKKLKNDLKKRLQEVSQDVMNKTGHPLIFIIDELDRCRPTFAIELLEGVKHIFDIHNMVFVFGINRTELSRTVNSIYGDIESSVYLRRFFDMEFLLPAPNSESFCKHLIEQYKLKLLFKELSEKAEQGVHIDDFQSFYQFFPRYCSHFDLSLRDIDYCIRSLIFIGKTIEERHYMYPILVGVLLVLRLKNPELYRKFIRGECLGSKVVDDIHESGKFNLNEKTNQDESSNKIDDFLDLIEVLLYSVTHIMHPETARDRNIALKQLESLKDRFELSNPEYLAKRTQNSSPERAKDLFHEMASLEGPRPFNLCIPIEYLFSLMELAEEVVSE